MKKTILVLQWLGLGALVGVLCGGASALFLWLLDVVTRYRTLHLHIVYALPIAGLVIGLLLERWGHAARAGNNLVIDTLHDDGPRIPIAMAPTVLVGSVLTHLFGGSAGREGTAVQMGASLGDALAGLLRVGAPLRRVALAAGIAGGFGSIFGTPVAGVVFALEVIVVGHLEYGAILPSLVAAIVGDRVTRGLGIDHAQYPIVASLAIDPSIIVRWLVFSCAIAIVTIVFIEALHRLKRAGERVRLPLRMLLGGLVVVGLWTLVGNDAYLGLGVPTILHAFDTHLPAATFAWKMLFTIVTLGVGFLGGEVTPLFFVGAALGNVLAPLLGLPTDLGAIAGMAAVFGAAANTPLALSVMAVELCGGAVLPHVAIVTIVAYVLVGDRGIYTAQRVRRPKAG